MGGREEGREMEAGRYIKGGREDTKGERKMRSTEGAKGRSDEGRKRRRKDVGEVGKKVREGERRDLGRNQTPCGSCLRGRVSCWRPMAGTKEVHNEGTDPVMKIKEGRKEGRKEGSKDWWIW